MRRLSAEDPILLIQLIRSVSIGPKAFWRLVEDHGSCQKALSYLSAKGQSICFYNDAKHEYEALLEKGYNAIFPWEEDFPELLKQIPDCPPFLISLGNRSILKKPFISVVGSRDASYVGRKIAFQLGLDLSQAGWGVVSGFARGIDQEAHQGAIENGTIGILAGGIDVSVSPYHLKLFEKVKETGLFLSEMPLGMAPKPQHFPRRNRIIAGMSGGLVVVEAGLKSGSLITAHLALDYGREVFAVPGCPLDERCLGSNALIQQGAMLIGNVDDIHKIFPAPLSLESSKDQTIPLTHKESLNNHLNTLVLNELSYFPIHQDQLLEKFKGKDVLSSLLELEIAGLIKRYPDQTLSKA